MLVTGTVDCKQHNHYTLFAAVLLTSSCQARSRKAKTMRHQISSVASYCAGLHFTLQHSPTVRVHVLHVYHACNDKLPRCCRSSCAKVSLRE
jgi:hypothetical protein